MDGSPRWRRWTAEVRRDRPTVEGYSVTVSVYRSGMRALRISRQAAVFGGLGRLIELLAGVLRHARSGRTWVVELRDPDTGQALAQRTVPDRASAMRLFESACERAGTVSLAQAGQALD